MSPHAEAALPKARSRPAPQHSAHSMRWPGLLGIVRSLVAERLTTAIRGDDGESGGDHQYRLMEATNLKLWFS